MERLTYNGDYCFMSCYEREGDLVGEECLLYKNCFSRQMFERLQHYEDLEEQGRLIELPIPLWKPYYEITESFNISMYILKPASAGRIIQNGLFGKYVFATKEEAEAKLKELKGE